MARKPKAPRTAKLHVDSIESAAHMDSQSLTKSIQDILVAGFTGEDQETGEPSPEGKKTKYAKNRVIFQSDRVGAGHLAPGDSYERPTRRLKDKDLIELAAVDPHISAIIATRVAQISSFGDSSESMFDKGIRILDMKAPKEKDFDTKEEYEREMDRRNTIKGAIMRWVLNCGTEDKCKLDQIFFNTDQTYKYCTLRQYLQAQARNLLTTGRCGRQNLRNQETGDLVAFRPIPIESIEPVRPDRRVWLTKTKENEEVLQEVESYNALPEGAKPIAWVQKIENQQVGFLTEKDLKISFYQMQANLDLNGYPLSPIEYAMWMILMHTRSLQYASNQFSKGLLSKGIIAISSTDPDVELAPEDIAHFRRQLQNLATRTENSSVVPIIAGPMTVQAIPLELTSKDLEWLSLEQNVIRNLCAAFQIDPKEVGFGLLGDPAGLSQGNKDYELVQGEERGLRILVDILIEDLNDAIYDNFPDAKEEFKLVAVGIGSETREAMLQRLALERDLTATMNDLLSQSEKNLNLEYGGDVPLSPAFHQNVVKYMTYGKFMEYFFGVEGGSAKPEWDFIIDPNLNQAYQQLKTGGQQAMIAQNQMAVAQVNAAQQQASQGQPQQQSLKDSYDSKEKMNKSFLEEWASLEH